MLVSNLQSAGQKGPQTSGNVLRLVNFVEFCEKSSTDIEELFNHTNAIRLKLVVDRVQVLNHTITCQGKKRRVEVLSAIRGLK